MERQCLERLSRSRRAAVRLAERATIVLHAADGLENRQIAERMGISRHKAGRWRQRYAQRGLPGIVLSCDGKSQIQALDRTQPSLPMKPGRAGTMTHDYKRGGPPPPPPPGTEAPPAPQPAVLARS